MLHIWPQNINYLSFELTILNFLLWHTINLILKYFKLGSFNNCFWHAGSGRYYCLKDNQGKPVVLAETCSSLWVNLLAGWWLFIRVLPSLGEQISLLKGCKRIRTSDIQGVETEGKIGLLIFLTMVSVHAGWFTSMRNKLFTWGKKGIINYLR